MEDVLKPYLIVDIPEDIWDALRADASSRETPDRFTNDDGRTYPSVRTERTGTSLNNVVCGILAEALAVEFEPTNRATFSQEPSERKLFLRMPDDMAVALYERARRQGARKREVVLEALAENYLLPVPVPRRPLRLKKHGRPRGRKAKA